MRATSNWLAFHTRFRPDAEALFDVSSGRRWSYAQLREWSSRWAGRLQADGVGPGDRVVVVAENRAETLALLFACAELGAILAPLNWRLAVPELRWQIDHCSPRIVLADPVQRARIGGLPLEEEPTAEPIEGPGAPLDAPWVLLYTSGSTGKPKGALLTHGQLHWNSLNTWLACDLQPSDATLTFTPLFHTGGLNCLTTPLLHRGGRVVLTTGFEPGEALRLIAEEKVSVLMGVPTIFQMMADHPSFDRTDLTAVRDALVGGAALPMPLLERYREREIPLRQGFGLTEVGPNCFSLPRTEIDRKAGTVGLPIPHVAAKVVRPDGSECGVDEPGELLLSGPAVFGGYWNDAEGTAKAVVNGWFHTGDMLSRDDEGYFRVRGRIKEMYISGGENVYPPEVEAVLHGLAGVAAAAVIGVPDERWGEVGAAFVEPAPGHSLTEEDIRTWVAPRLARFKQPRYVRVLPTLPRTASGKIDRVSLSKEPR
ncbi:MAG: long-chain fatty acid--CoA ligase [Pseudomonadota bacterium]|nr:long-chain fatty acid--CoA ligase [Pseudomonadota bacterium]